MTTHTLNVVALQLRAHDRSTFDAAWPGILAHAEAALAPGDVDLLVMPEATLPGYVLGGDDIDDAATQRALDELAQLAERTASAIVVGAVMRAGERLRNAAVVIDRDGSIAGRADKAFLWHFDRLWFEPGDVIEPIVTSIGTLGALVCADGRLPTIATALVARGARALVMPTAWVSSGRDPHSLENVQADLLARVRAYENGVPFVAANKCGAERNVALYCGKSQIVDASGEVLAIAPEAAPQPIAARVAFPGAVAPRAAARTFYPAPAATHDEPVRVAICAESFSHLNPSLPAWVQADYFIGPDATGQRERLGAAVPIADVDDATARSPEGVAGLRRAGYRAFVWETRATDGWTLALARARALEARVYAIVIDAFAGRAFAVDPDGTVVCGTFGEYRVASFVLDPRKTLQTAVAPGTDVVEGLDRVEAILSRSATSR